MHFMTLMIGQHLAKNGAFRFLLYAQGLSVPMYGELSRMPFSDCFCFFCPAFFDINLHCISALLLCLYSPPFGSC